MALGWQLAGGGAVSRQHWLTVRSVDPLDAAAAAGTARAERPGRRGRGAPGRAARAGRQSSGVSDRANAVWHMPGAKLSVT